MSPPDDTDSAEIYVEGKRKLVDGFVRWCRRGNKNVGLNQITQVKEVIDENPVGLYDDFYVKMQ
jgi:acylphosphatase